MERTTYETAGDVQNQGENFVHPNVDCKQIRPCCDLAIQIQQHLSDTSNTNPNEHWVESPHAFPMPAIK